MNRKASGIIILGYTGTGKTTFAKELARKELKKGGRVLVVSPDPMEWNSLNEIEISELRIFNGIAKIVYEKDILQPIFDNFYNGLIIFDDYRVFGITANSKEGALMLNFLRRKRQFMRDIVFVAHGFTEIIPTALYTNATYIVLFETKDNINTARNALLNFKAMQHHQTAVNRLTKTEPVKNYMSYHRIIKQ